MKRTRFVAVVLAAALVMGLVATTAVAQRGQVAGVGRGDRAAGMRAAGPVFTDEQKEEMKEIHEKYDDERVELANRARVLQLEMGELLTADDPDFDDIEDKIEQIHAVRLELAKMRLRIHQEIRPLLTDDQRTLFDRGLCRMGERMMDGRGGMSGRGAGHRGMRGKGMCRGPAGTQGRQMQGQHGMGMWGQPAPQPEGE